jgi:glyoxylase-like metal-dependent hydrolase (beta-lactamase superfamily II)
VLGALIGVGTLSIAAAGSQGQQGAPKIIRMQSMGVRDNLYLLSGGGGNTAALIADTGVVLVDTKLAGWGQAVLDALKAVTDTPVTTVINTHTHGDHTGSNKDFPTVIDIVAHENTKANMQKMDAFKGTNARFLPNKTYMAKMSLLDGRDRIDLHDFGAGHTNGDTIVVFPALRVAHLGDLFPSKATPFIDTSNGGSGVAFPETLAKAVAGINDVDRVITGHGTPPPGAVASRMTTWKDLQEYADFNRDFLAAVREAFKAGKSTDEAVAGLELPDRYKEYSMERAKANVQAIYDELKR